MPPVHLMDGIVRPVVTEALLVDHRELTDPFDAGSVRFKEMITSEELVHLFELSVPQLMRFIRMVKAQMGDRPEPYIIDVTSAEPLDELLIAALTEWVGFDSFTAFLAEEFGLELLRDSETQFSIYPAEAFGLRLVRRASLEISHWLPKLAEYRARSQTEPQSEVRGDGRVLRGYEEALKAYADARSQSSGLIEGYIKARASLYPKLLLEANTKEVFLSSVRKEYPLGYATLFRLLTLACAKDFLHHSLPVVPLPESTLSLPAKVRDENERQRKLLQQEKDELVRMLGSHPIRLKLEQVLNVQFRLNLPGFISIRHIGAKAGSVSGSTSLDSWDFALMRTCFLVCHVLS